MNGTATRNLNSMSLPFSKLVKEEHENTKVTFDILTYSSVSGVEKIKDRNGKEYGFDGENYWTFKGKPEPLEMNPVPLEKPKKCPSEKWADQGGCWPYKKTGECKHMEV